MIDLIFCGGNNPNYARIAIDAGFKYGAQLPCTTYGKVYFADQNWKKPDRKAYMAALATHRPHIASIIDWEYKDQLDEVLDWAIEVSLYVDKVMIIPKVHNGIEMLPLYIYGKPVILGYSVPTTHGGTEVILAEFQHWPIHLLGGSPGSQMRLAQYLNVESADGNMAMKMANRGLFWKPGKKLYSNSWVSLLNADGKKWYGNACLEAFRRSCNNIMEAWLKM